jgi:hypothetical protein
MREELAAQSVAARRLYVRLGVFVGLLFVGGCCILNLVLQNRPSGPRSRILRIGRSPMLIAPPLGKQFRFMGQARGQAVGGVNRRPLGSEYKIYMYR